jgi:hypothetical protein
VDDSTVRPRNFSPSSIRALLDQDNEPTAKGTVPRGNGATLEHSDPLPLPGESYRGHARRSDGPEPMIHFVLKDFSYEGFSYADCERVRLVRPEKPGGGPILIVRFSGSVITEALIEGRNLHSLYHAIGLHQMPWIWEHPAPADFTNDKATLIRRITFREVER